jgi:predicted hydrocarbon binding protein
MLYIKAVKQQSINMTKIGGKTKLPTKRDQGFTKSPKRILLVEEEANNLYEISIALKDVIGALAKVTKFVAEQGVNIRSGILFTSLKFKHVSVCTSFIDLSNAKCSIDQLVELLKQIDVVTDVRVVKPWPIPVDQIHFPLLITENDRGIIFSPEIFADLQHNLEEVYSPSAAHTMLYYAGKNCGTQACRRLAEKYGLSGLELFEAVLKLKQAEGWGIFQTRKFNPTPHQGEIVVKEGFEAIRYGKSSKPVCYFLKGYLAGTLKTAFNINVSLAEKTCIAMGAKECIFELVSRSENEDEKIANRIKTNTG